MTLHVHCPICDTEVALDVDTGAIDCSACGPLELAPDIDEALPLAA